MPFLIATGLLSALFFSSTFLLNRAMSLSGGHWYWSASLRYVFMLFFLLLLLIVFQGSKTPLAVIRLFCRNWPFWLLAGSVGFGGFYSLICFSADHAPGWVVAATWQLTIIASLLVLMLFGRSFAKKIWLFSLLIFSGVVLINTAQLQSFSPTELLLGGFPVLIAAFCYPLGNQLVWEAIKGHPRLPRLASPLFGNPFNKVFLLSLGSLPFWMLLLVVIRPPPPSSGQIVNTAMVALFSGIFATSLFLYARGLAKDSAEIAAVDATQSTEVVFAMLGEMLLLAAPLPGKLEFVGMAMVFFGLGLFAWFQQREKKC